MGWPKGKPRPEGAGRKAGTPNKKSLPLRELAEKLEVDPFNVLLLFAKGDWETLGYASEMTVVGYSKSGEPYEGYTIAPGMRMKAAAEAVQYLEPKRKAVEVSGSLDMRVQQELEGLMGLTEEELVALIKKELK